MHVVATIDDDENDVDRNSEDDVTSSRLKLLGI